MPILPIDFTMGITNSTTASPIGGDSQHQRDVWDIIWSCVMTIFACTWVAIHPNIPAVSDTGMVLAFRRAGLMVCGLIAPEIIILWAMRQWHSARKIGQRHKARGWTITHGFFLQMGGFMLYAEDKALYPLKLEDLENLFEKGEIQWPQITESEIQDRSKSDTLSKGIVILQTSWFVIQCIVRGSTGLVITSLELMTLAFAALNVVTYFFWWNKPVDVRYPHQVHLKSGTRDEHQAGQLDAEMDVTDAEYNPTPLPTPPPPPYEASYPGRSYGPAASQQSLNLPSDRLLMLANFLVRLVRPVSAVMRWLKHVVRAIMGKSSTSDRVPTFYAATLAPDPHTFFWMTIACSILGSTFGGIHCIAWSFQFTSHQEQILWRISSMIITCGPVLVALLSTYHSYSLRKSRKKPISYSWGWLFWLVIRAFQIVMVVSSVVVYIAARLVLAVQACMALRALSPGALQATEWTHFIPHF